MSVTPFLVLSALLFSIGAVGVLVRRVDSLQHRRADLIAALDLLFTGV